MKRFDLFLPWILVCIATVGSLFFSEWYRMEPCTLCWYQRIVIFPLVIILGIAAFRGAYRIVLYVLPLSVIGLLIAGYQTVLILFFSKSNLCSACTLEAVSSHPVTFPLLSFFAFLILTALLIWIYYRHKKSKKL